MFESVEIWEKLNYLYTHTHMEIWKLISSLIHSYTHIKDTKGNDFLI